MPADTIVDHTILAIPGPRDQPPLPARENLFKALVLIALLGGSFYLADRIADALAATTVLTPTVALVLTWTVVLALAAINTVLLSGLGILAHEAVHHLLCRSTFWNELGGGILAALALTPFYANRQFHLTHHGYAHQPNLDPEEAVHLHSFWFAATVGPLLGVVELLRIFFGNFRRIGEWRHASRALKDTAFVSFAVAVYFVLIPALHMSLSVTVLPLLALMPLGFGIRAVSDHYGLPPVVRETKKPREEVLDGESWYTGRERHEASGWVVMTAPWLEWMWSHTNYHEVHHKYPYLPHTWLPRVFNATREHYPYEVVHGYWRSFVSLCRVEYYGAQRGALQMNPKPEEYRAAGQP